MNEAIDYSALKRIVRAAGWLTLVTAAVGELVFMLWLLIWGVKIPAGTGSTGVASK